MKLKDALETYQDRLSDADQRLLGELLGNPTGAAFLSAQELANRVGVHPASAVRLAKKLGYAGYPKLRAALAEEVRERVEGGDRIRRTLQKSGGRILTDLVAREQAALVNLLGHIHESDLERAAQTLLEARRVYLYAQGHATALVEFLLRRLNRFGMATVDLRAQGRDLAERALGLERGDAVLAFALRTQPKGLSPLLRHAHARKAKTILLTDVLGIEPRAGLELFTPRGAAQEFQTLTAPMTVVNALVLTVAQLEPRVLPKLDTLNKLIETFEEEA